MARSVRIEYPGAVYHVMCRGDRREPIFDGDRDRKVFLETLGEACERAGFVVHSYVLMPNHYHLLLETPSGNLIAAGIGVRHSRLTISPDQCVQGAYIQRAKAFLIHAHCGGADAAVMVADCF